MTILSFFSGAGGLDLGLEQAGFRSVLFCESDPICQATLRANRPGVPLLDDIHAATTSELPEADGIVGGPPCQSFSSMGARKGVADERGELLFVFARLIVAKKPRFFILENVEGLLKREQGRIFRELLDVFAVGGYRVTQGLLNAACFGVPQTRKRLILVGTRGTTPILLPVATHPNPAGWQTFRQATQDILKHTFPSYSPNMLRFFQTLREGQNWRHLPSSLQREAMGAALQQSGGKTRFYGRLAWDKPAPTLMASPMQRATGFCHPDEDRPLSIEEYKRLQQFPDTWQLCGTLMEQYRQVGNAVPVGLGIALGRALQQAIQR